jgi:hypothetical protein
MRKLSFYLMAAALFLAAGISRAQTVGSASNVNGTNYWPILVSAGVYQTNQVYQAGAYKTVTVGGITSTNENIAAYYVFNPTNGLTPAPGLPGYYIANFVTNSFAAGTNGGAYSFTFNGGGVTVACPVQFGFAITGGNFTNTLYVP